MSEAPLTDAQDPTKASDAQKIAIYVAQKLGGAGMIGNVTGLGTATSGNFAAYADSSGKKIHDTGYGPSSFGDATQADIEARFQRSERRVQNGNTRTVKTWTSDTIVGPFNVEDGGTLVIEDEGILLVH
jgi:hypothetical protein